MTWDTCPYQESPLRGGERGGGDFVLELLVEQSLSRLDVGHDNPIIFAAERYAEAIVRGEGNGLDGRKAGAPIRPSNGAVVSGEWSSTPVGAGEFS